MKCTTAVALLPLLASAVSIEARQAANLQYEISNFSSTCTPEDSYCFYDISIVTSDNPEFGVSCEAIGTSEKGELPVVNETQCGTYTVAVAKSDDGGLILTVRSDQKRRVGTYTIPSDDITTAASGGQSYTGDSSFTIDVKNASSGSASGSASVSGTSAAATSTPTVSSASSASPSASSISSTTTLEPSTTGTTTSSSSSPSESTNGAAREGAFAGVLFAAGLMALAF